MIVALIGIGPAEIFVITSGIFIVWLVARIHARSSHALIPSTMARNVVAMNRLRTVNRQGHRGRKIIASEPRL